MILNILSGIAWTIACLYVLLVLFCLGLAATINWRAALLPLALLFEAVFFVIGLVVVPIAVLLGAYRYRLSERYPERYVLSWTSNWLWVWGNEEDGVDGVPLDMKMHRPFKNIEWRMRTQNWSERRRVIAWAALRNAASNLRFTKWGLLIDPRKIVVHHNSGGEWFVSQGWRSTYWYQGRRWRFWIGWNIKPWDYSPFATALAEGDPRGAGAGFKSQIKRAR